MTNQPEAVTAPVTVSIPAPEVVKAKRTRRPMEATRKENHHVARRLLESLFVSNPALEAQWTALYPEKQLRVLSNLLLDYVPGFLTFAVPFTADQITACSTVLAAAAADTKAYRKSNKAIHG